MAKSKRPKSPPPRPSSFFETLPMAVMPPAILPGLPEHFSEGTAALSAFGRRTLTWLRHPSLPKFRLGELFAHRLVPAAGHTTRAIAIRLRNASYWLAGRLMLAGLATTNRLIHSGRMLRYTVSYSTAATANYAPPIVADFGRTTRRGAKAVAGKRARITYLLLATAGLITAGTVGTIVGIKTVKAYASDISSPAALMATKKTGTVILDRNGKALFAGYGAQIPQPIPLSQMPTNLKNATIAAEDPSFYSNPGFSLRGTVRAAVVDVTHRQAAEGGSTLTQQLVKNELLNSNKDLHRKYQEFLLSIELAHRYSKNQILDMYLNDIYYGQGSAGVQVASETYFHKPANQLTLDESALIAGLPLGPSRFDPNFDLSAATDRRNYVLGRMQQLGMISASTAHTAEAQPIQLAAAGAPQTAPTGSHPMLVYAQNVTIQAPWFVFYVLQQLRNEYGDQMVEQGGITVQTTLDLTKEQAAEKIIASQINNLAPHNVTDGALVSLDPSNGDILSMVGSVNYNAPGFGNVNATLSDLQPGSSFKPIAYATAFEKGWTGATQVLDAPISFPQDNGQTYTPENYDLKFHGVVTLRHALDNSLNIPAIKVLQYATIPSTLQTAHDLGITTLNDPSQYGLSLVLGGGDVTPIDMATVYGTLDNNGVKVEPRAIVKVTDRHGKNITKNTQPAPQQVLDPRIAYMLTNIMSDNPARLPEFPLNGPLELDRPAAAKTGTTNDFRDNWTIGYTPQVVTAVWVGNADHSAMENVDGITGAAPIWHDYMEMASAGTPVENFTPPPGITTLNICSDGGLAPAGGAGIYPEVFMSDALPTRQCGAGLTTPAPTPSASPAAPTPEPAPVPEVVPEPIEPIPFQRHNPFQ